MFADNLKLLSELVTEYPVTDQDIAGLNENKSTYCVWLRTGYRQTLEDEREDQWYNGVLDKITAWIRIVTHGYAVQNIRISGYQDVYVTFTDTDGYTSGEYRGDFFLKLCHDHVTNAGWIFSETWYQDKVREHTQSFVHRVDVALKRMMKDWTPYNPSVPFSQPSAINSLFKALLPTWDLLAIGNEHVLDHVYLCVGGLVGYLHPSAIVWTWNTAVGLMMDTKPDKMTRLNAFIEKLHEYYDAGMVW